MLSTWALPNEPSVIQEAKYHQICNTAYIVAASVVISCPDPPMRSRSGDIQLIPQAFIACCA